MNTQLIALAVITAALAGIGVAHVERLVRSGFDLLPVARNRSHIANRISRDEEGCYEMRVVYSGERQLEKR